MPRTPKTARLSRNPTLLQALMVFLQHASPRALLVGSALAVLVRVSAFSWSIWDVVLIAGMVLAQPFVEWIIHVFILHFRPITVLGKTFDLKVAKLHRAHHRAPWQLDLIFIPGRALAVGLGFAAVVWGAVLPTADLFATAVTWTFLSTLAYEWIHFLTHTNVRPSSPWYRKRWRLHRLHHFKNEHYWMGVTTHLGDRVLGTMPSPEGVELSATCRTLGVD